MACVVHQGSYELLTGAYEAIMGWIESNGYRVTGPSRDVYLQGPESGLDAADYVTEVQFPLSKEPVSSFVMQGKEKSAMEPKIVTKAEFTVVGMRYYGKNENNEIAQLWQEFMPRMGEIKHQRKGGAAYGVCRDMTEDDEFEYVAGMEVDRADDIPEGMVSRTVPAQKYAVFTCTLPTIGAAYEHALRTWLPQSGYKRACGPDFELYDETFDAQKEDSELFIYIPIE
jgi:AraC family transcriptional regulator